MGNISAEFSEKLRKSYFPRNSQKFISDDISFISGYSPFLWQIFHIFRLIGELQLKIIVLLKIEIWEI